MDRSSNAPTRPRGSRRAFALLLILPLASCSWWDSEPEVPPEPSPPAQTPVANVPVPEIFVDAEAEPDEGPAPLTAKFTANLEDHLGPVECEWDFGDGSPKEKGMSPTHVYKTEDDFIATVVCKDSKGIRGETAVDVTVYKYE